jgi:hypothetical protein
VAVTNQVQLLKVDKDDLRARLAFKDSLLREAKAESEKKVAKLQVDLEAATKENHKLAREKELLTDRNALLEEEHELDVTAGSSTRRLL